jgi:hypothetical protein
MKGMFLVENAINNQLSTKNYLPASFERRSPASCLGRANNSILCPIADGVLETRLPKLFKKEAKESYDKENARRAGPARERAL